MEKQVNKFTFKPKVIWDDDILYRTLTRKILIEKIQFRIKEFIKRGWKFSGSISVDENRMHKCDLCKTEIGIVYYDNVDSNKSLTICSSCDIEVFYWKNYVKK